MAKNIFLFTLSVILFYYLVGCVPFPSQGTDEVDKFAYKKIRTEDFVYEDSIKTVLLHLDIESKTRYFQINAVPITQPTPLILSFDEIGYKQKNYYVRIIHCNADWTPSILNDFEFLNDFNDFLPKETQVSFNTKVSYIHYKFLLPKLKISGNYVIMVHRENNPKDFILTKRLVVYENQITIEPAVRFSIGVEERRTNQQIDFVVKYDNYPTNLIMNNVRDDFKVVVRQNKRWDNAIYNLKPFMVRELDKQIDFNLLDLSNNFKGLNEYRRFEMQSIRFLGFNLNSINAWGKVVEATLNTDGVRNGIAYIQNPDFNGGFIINNFELDAGDREADYVQIIFTLKSPQQLDGNVYVVGAFNQWATNEKNSMMYNPNNQLYYAKILMKQGIYDYGFGVKANPNAPLDEAQIEGSHQATENMYDILIYHKPVGARSEMLIGYKTFSSVQGN